MIMRQICPVSYSKNSRRDLQVYFFFFFIDDLEVEDGNGNRAIRHIARFANVWLYFVALNREIQPSARRIRRQFRRSRGI